MKKKICVLVSIIISISNYAQNFELPNELVRQKVLNNNIAKDVQGTPFYNDAFLLGTIYKNDNKSFKAYLRYDAFNDEMQMKQNEDIKALSKFENDKVEIANTIYEVQSYFKDGSDQTGYFINLTKQGTTRLLMHKSKKFVEGVKAQNSYSTDKPPMFKDDISYYLMKNDSLNLVALSKKNVLTLLEDKKKELDTYISDNKLKLKHEDDFIQLISFYNSL